jgi:hypothetical protein
VLAAGRIGPDGAGLHICRAVKSGFDTVLAGLDEHLSGSITNGYVTDIDLFIFGNYFIFSHL